MADARISPATARKPTGITKTATEPKVRKRGYKRITVACTYCRHRKVRCEFTNDEDPYRRCDNCIKLDRNECRLRPVNENEEPDELHEGEGCCGSASPSPSLSLDGMPKVKAEDAKSPVQAPLAALPATTPPFGTFSTGAPSPRNEGLTRSNSAASTSSRRATADSLASTPIVGAPPAAPQMILPSQKMQPAHTWSMPADLHQDMSYDAFFQGGFWNEPFAAPMPGDMAFYPSPQDMHAAGFPPLPTEAMAPADFMWGTSPTDMQPMHPLHSSTMAPQDLHKHQPHAPVRANSSEGRMQHTPTMPLVPPQWVQAPVTDMPHNFNPFDMAWDGFAKH